MTATDRRSMLLTIAGGAAAAVGLALLSDAAESAPLSSGVFGGAVKPESLVEEARTVVVSSRHPRRRHPRRRRRVCYWRRGRRVCVWRY
jgi:hypothetical protein